jgi:Peptidase M15
MPTVNYNNKKVSDEGIRNFLHKVAAYFNRNVNVTSGDRNYVPPGGSRTSHHLAHRAADFHVNGKTDREVYDALKSDPSFFFHPDCRYQVILHGVYTATGGQHLHCGRYLDGSGVAFYTEGLTKSQRGKYTKDGPRARE